MTKVVGILGSPRKNGNTDFLLKKSLSSISGGKVSTRIIRLSDLRLEPCTECNCCYNTGKCIIKDDIGKVFKAIEEADIIIVASPVFFMGVSAQTKIIIDRSQSQWAKRYVLGKMPHGAQKAKKGVFIAVRGGKGKKDILEPIAKPVKAFFGVHGIKYTKGILIDDTDAKGDIRKNKKALTSTVNELNKTIKSYEKEKA